MRMSNRLRRRERAGGGGDGGCPACRERRGLTAVVICQRLPDGTTTEAEGEPAPCEYCGEVPEKVIRIVEAVVASRENLARLAAEDRPRSARRAGGERL